MMRAPTIRAPTFRAPIIRGLWGLWLILAGLTGVSRYRARRRGDDA